MRNRLAAFQRKSFHTVDAGVANKHNRHIGLIAGTAKLARNATSTTSMPTVV